MIRNSTRTLASQAEKFKKHGYITPIKLFDDNEISKIRDNIFKDEPNSLL